MKSNNEYPGINHQKTIADIAAYGLTVILIEASNYLPSFGYSIGLWQRFKHPEIICFGLSIKTLQAIINNAAGLVKEGQAIEASKIYSNILKNNNAVFIPVDERNTADYLGTAIDFYNQKKVPALQLVWTDRNGRFPWEAGFDESFRYQQPLLDRNAGFKFREPENRGVITSNKFFNEGAPILRVVHEPDGTWQFLTEDFLLLETEDALTNAEKETMLVCLKHVVDKDPSLNEVFDLDYGEFADRKFIGGKWEREFFEEEEEG